MKGLQHDASHLETSPLANFLLDDRLRPVLCRRPIVSRDEAKDRLALRFGVMKCVHATDHDLLVEEREVINDPRDATCLRAYLSENFRRDRLQILSKVDRTGEDYLSDDRNLLQCHSLQLPVEL